MSGVILVGPAGAGKDTVAAWIAADFGAVRLGFADPLRRFTAEMLGPGKHRAALQAIGDALRAEAPDVLITAARRRAAGLPRWVITDARSVAEINAWPDALTVAIVAPLALRQARLRQRDGVTPQSLHHPTEAVDAAVAQCTVRLDNTGTLADLAAAYDQTLRPLLLGHWGITSPLQAEG